MDDVQHNFEFRLSVNRMYYGVGETPREGYKSHIETLLEKEFSGNLHALHSSRGTDTFEGGGRQFEFWVSEYHFPGHSLCAIVIGEMYPEDKEDSSTEFVVRVRLGKYDTKDPFTRKLSERLSVLSLRNPES